MSHAHSGERQGWTVSRKSGLEVFPMPLTSVRLSEKILFGWMLLLYNFLVFFFLVFSFLLYTIKIVPKHWNLLSIASRKLCFTSRLKISKHIPVTLQCTSAVALTVRPIFHLSWRFHYSIKCIPVCPSGKKYFCRYILVFGDAEARCCDATIPILHSTLITVLFNKTVLLTTKTSVFLSFISSLYNQSGLLLIIDKTPTSINIKLDLFLLEATQTRPHTYCKL